MRVEKSVVSLDARDMDFVVFVWGDDPRLQEGTRMKQ